MTTAQYKEKFPGFKMGVGRRGKLAWSRGLTKETDERIARSAIKTSKTMKGNYIPHNKDKSMIEEHGEEKAQIIKDKISKGCKGNLDCGKGNRGKISFRKGITNKEEFGEKKAKDIRDKISKKTIQNYRDYPELLGSNIIERIVYELNKAKKGGVDTIVDTTTLNLGRNVHILAE